MTSIVKTYVLIAILINKHLNMKENEYICDKKLFTAAFTKIKEYFFCLTGYFS